MENITRSQAEKTSDDALVLASLILLDVRRNIESIQMIVAFLLRYVTLGASIADSLVGWIIPIASDES